MKRPSQQAKELLEDLRASCCSPNKSVQLDALKCWGDWINNQNQEDWKLNTVCYTAVRPLLTKKLQPLQKDVDVCKLRFSLLWALLRKVQNIIQLEGPQYVMEVFLQSCLNWLSSAGDGGEEITELIFHLLLAIFSKEESINTRDKEMFGSLSTDLLKVRKVFNRLADKFLSVFVYWKKAQNKSVILRLWRHFLEHCEVSCEHIAVPVWHKVFKLLGQICSEKSEPVKERLGMLHGCATTLSSVLSSSKFLDFGNSLLTPCEALLKRLVELSCSECWESYDAEMFVQGMEVSKVLSVESVAIGGYALCISVLNLLDEFSLKCLYWGVWCGLVHCYESLLSNIDRNHLTKEQTIFYRKLRGVAVNFELDKNHLGEECIKEVEKHIRRLNISLCTCRSKEVEGNKETASVLGGSFGHSFGQLVPGMFSRVKKGEGTERRIVSISLDLVNHILKTVGVSWPKTFLDNVYDFRFISVRVCDVENNKPKDFLISLKPPCRRGMMKGNEKKAITYPVEKDEWVRKTRSQKRAEEEEKKKDLESQKRKTRKSFEIRVQEIVQKNKERKTEKNRGKPREKRKSVDGDTSERTEKKKRKEKKSSKLEKYFKVIKKSGKNEEEEKKKKKKKKEEVNWKQRSLVTMMIQGKEEEGVRTRSKEKEVGSKGKTRMMEKSPLSKLSPFKEVFHDHEYARMELDDLKALERVVVRKEGSEKKSGKVRKSKEMGEGKVKKEGMRKSKRLEKEVSRVPEITSCVSSPEIGKELEVEKSKIRETEGIIKSLEEVPEIPIKNEAVESPRLESKEVEVVFDGGEESRWRMESANVDEVEEGSDSTPRRGKKRFRILDSLKPSKKVKLEEEKLELEVEKENLEEVKEEKMLKGSPKTVKGMISSRALRMIALVPESTRSQVHWETSPKVEVKKKGPNVDKNSRASKMLALLTGNVVEPVETKPDEEKSNGDLSNALVKTPTSSLKSPKTVKQRRSIRFDDTKNETVVYETDTPPSQVREGKEKWRKVSSSPIRSGP